MGSVISFPILCIANAAICRYAIEQDRGRKLLLRDCPLGINGDDAVFRATEQGKRLWETIGTFCGLKPSVGKVYYSDEFLNLNSTTYTYHLGGVEGSEYTVERKDEWGNTVYATRVLHFEQVDYVNLGLLMGMKRSGGGFDLADTTSYSSIGSRARKVVSSAPEFLREKLLTKFIAKNKKALTSFNIPWFIPEHLGGLGLPCVGKYQAEDRWLRVARKIEENPQKYRLPNKGSDAEWLLWKKASSRFSRLSSTAISCAYEHHCLSKKHDQLTSFNGVVGMQCVAELFHADGIADLKLDTVTANMNYYRQTARVWNKALKDQSVPLPEPFSPDNFPIHHSVDDRNIVHIVPRLTEDLECLFLNQTTILM
jgi:hypothetical protein